MAALANDVATGALLAVGKISQALSGKGRRGLGRLLGRGMLHASARRLAITEDNVRQAFPDMPEAARARIVRECYDNLGIVLAETLAIPALSEQQIRNSVSFRGMGPVVDRLRSGLPIVFVSGHFGNWEYLAMSGALQMQSPFTIVAHPQKNRRADEILNGYRTRFGNRIVPMGNAAKTLVRTIREGGTLAFLVDQHADAQRDPWIDFFGRPAPTYEAPAALALRFGIPLYTGFAVRTNDGGYTADLREILTTDLTNTPECIRELTRRHVQALEDAVRAHPGLWSWQHRRWRS